MRGPIGCLERRHHVYPSAQWVCLPRCRNRLVQQIRFVLPSLQQLRDKLLPRRPRRSDRTPRAAQNIQHRSRPFNLHRRSSFKRLLAGIFASAWRKRKGFGQCVCGASMEICEVRKCLSARLPECSRCKEGSFQLFPVLQHEKAASGAPLQNSSRSALCRMKGKERLRTRAHGGSPVRFPACGVEYIRSSEQKARRCV